MSQSRQLAAIMFTDIVGYTALMGKDEQKAFELLRKNRAIHKPLIKQFHGTWIKELGDGVLASFHTVTDAAFCAAAIHQACNNVDGLQLRIGIHLGEVIFEDHDVFGDGVNIASRLQAMASIGSTWVSEAVYKNLVNKKEIAIEFVKEEMLKNVSEPVKVYEISVNEVAGYLPGNKKPYQKQNSAGKSGRNKTIFITGVTLLVGLAAAFFLFFNKQTKQVAGNKKAIEKSIAVLYFDNMTGDPEQEYLSDGLTEEIISHLAGIKGLRVISRTSVLPYKGKPYNMKKIAEELKVATLLEGSLRKSGDRIKITAQLIDGKTDSHFWVADFTKEFKDIFELQGDVARSIAQKLEVEITPDASAKIDLTPTSNIDAYYQFQKGKFFLYKKYLNTAQPEDFKKSKKYFEQAIQLDPTYAEAYAGLAELYDERRNKNVNEFPDSLLKLKVKLAKKAVQLNPSSSFANTAMIWAFVNHPESKIDSGYFYAKRAFDIDPSDPLNIYNLSAILSENLGLNKPAIPLTLRAIKTDPLDPNLYSLLGHQYAMQGKYPEAKKAFQICMELTDDQFNREFPFLLWLIYFGDFDKAEKRLAARAPKQYLFVKSFLYARKNEPDKISHEHRNDNLILLTVNRNKISKEIIKRIETEVEKNNNTGIANYDYLTTCFYYDTYRTDPDFKRVLSKAKKNHEANLLKYGKIELPE